MKKSLIILALMGGVFLTSCDPQKAEGEFMTIDKTPETLLNGATFAQFDMVDGKYVPSETGNYIQYEFPGIQAVTVFYKKGDERKVLAYGRAGGICYYMPSRGSEPLQTLYFAYLNGDGTEIVAEKQFTLNVAQSLDPAVKILVSNKGTKKWKWMPTSTEGGAVWGNGGYLAGEQDGSVNVTGAWWGCGTIDGDCSGSFEDQTQHAGDRWPDIKGECYTLSYMEFNEDGSLNAYSNEGILMNEGKFSIKDYNKNEITNAANNSRGTLETSAGAILWPFAINTGGQQPTAFEIGWLDPSRMILIYAAAGTGAWSECTWWSFMSDDDAEGILGEQKDGWHWKPTSLNGGAVWGNAGYLAGWQDGTGAINGAWWGCGLIDGDCDDKFDGQTQHAGDNWDKYEADCYAKSKMVFNEDEASITVYDQNDNVIRSGSFSVEMKNDEANFSIGTLNTSEGTILWPFAINTGGSMPTSFQIGYLDSNTMILQYAAPGTGAWSECTWWSFGK